MVLAFPLKTLRDKLVKFAPRVIDTRGKKC